MALRFILKLRFSVEDSRLKAVNRWAIDMKHLYHGTLIRHHNAIESVGLEPRIGNFTKKFYGENSTGLLPAVFMADEAGLERVVHAMVATIMDEVTEEDFEEWDIGPDQHLNDALFCKYGVIYMIETSDGFSVSGNPKEGTAEPLQAEDGDRYSLVAVRPATSLTGDDLRAFLEEKGILPSNINVFVDEDRKPIEISFR